MLLSKNESRSFRKCLSTLKMLNQYTRAFRNHSPLFDKFASRSEYIIGRDLQEIEYIMVFRNICIYEDWWYLASTACPDRKVMTVLYFKVGETVFLVIN